MAQITSGLRSVLSHSSFYDAFQNALGARAIRREFADRYVRARAGDKLLDIGCGTAQMLDFLPEVEYWGYDISPDYIAAARSRYGARGRFQCKLFDNDELAKLPRFDLVLAVGLVHHLDDREAAAFFSLAQLALVPGGRLVTLDPCFSPDQNPLARSIIAADRGRNVRNADGYQALAAGAFRSVDGNLRHRRWIPYTHWIMECMAGA